MLNEQFCDASFFTRTPRSEVAVLEAEHRGLTEEIDRLMQEWEALEARLGELTPA